MSCCSGNLFGLRTDTDNVNKEDIFKGMLKLEDKMSLAGEEARPAQKESWCESEAENIAFLWRYLLRFLRRPHVSYCFVINRLKNVYAATARARREQITDARPVARPLATPRADLSPLAEAPPRVDPRPLANAPPPLSPDQLLAPCTKPS